MVSEKLKDYGKRMGQGFLMGFSAGVCVGLFVGSLTVLTVGPAPGKTYFSTVGKSMLQTGGWLGAVLSIGSVIRGEGLQNHKYPRGRKNKPLDSDSCTGELGLSILDSAGGDSASLVVVTSDLLLVAVARLATVADTVAVLGFRIAVTFVLVDNLGLLFCERTDPLLQVCAVLQVFFPFVSFSAIQQTSPGFSQDTGIPWMSHDSKLLALIERQSEFSINLQVVF